MEGTRGPRVGGAPTFALYRIIGNDLPPRHVPGQHLRNLAFVLDHEPELERCERWWVLNRLTDRGEQAELADLLEERGCRYLTLEFSLEEYARLGWRLDFDRPLYDAAFHALPEGERLRMLEHTYHDKNRYVMHNNGARNVALEHGRSRADYVLPWDGNCFVTAPAWRELLAAVDADSDADYLVVPMARAGDEEVLHHDETWRPEARDEPQIAFARDAPERFDDDLRYGRNPKAALLRALGVPGIWNERTHEPWEPGLPEPASARGRYVRASWVVRLTSGRADLETRPSRRIRQRREAIARKLDGLDERAARRVFCTEEPFAWDHTRLGAQREAWRRGEPPLVRIVADLCAAVERARPVDGPATGAVLGGLAWWLTGREELGRRAAGCLERLVELPPADLAPRTTLTGSPQGPSTTPGDRVVPTDLIHVAEAARLLEAGGAVDPGLAGATRAWFAGLLEVMVAGRTTTEAAQRADHHGLWFEALTLAAAAHADEVTTLTTTYRRVCSRLRTQVGPDGRPLGDLETSCSRDASASAVLAWLTLSRMAGRFGEDLFRETGADGQGVATVVDWFLGVGAGPWPGRQSRPHDLDVTDAVALRAAWQYPRHVDPAAVPDPGVAYRIKQRFPPGTGIRPFWALGE